MIQRLLFQTNEDGSVLLGGLDEFLVSLIRDLPQVGSPEPDSEPRLFPSLTEGRQPEADADWAEFVRPELEAHFQVNRDRVFEDCSKIRQEGQRSFKLEISQKSAPAWIHAINQARLSLAAKYHFSEEQLEHGNVGEGPERLAMFQMQFYGMLQEWLLSVTETL